jgi:hypothetical protein
LLALLGECLLPGSSEYFVFPLETRFETVSWTDTLGHDASIIIIIIILWNQGVQTDREVLANRPDTIIKKP